MRTRIKICGITRPEDALAAAQSGADAIGFVFYAESPRYIEPQAARVIASQLPPFVTKVGLFVDASADEVRATREVVGLDLLQFHGVELAEYCQGFARPYIKVIHMRPDVDWRQMEQDYAGAAGLLVDAYTPQHGGSGVTFDWRQLPSDLSKPLIVAGGLTPENVAQMIAAVRPYGVDVSSGVEQAKGIKDAAKIAAFINEVNRQQ